MLRLLNNLSGTIVLLSIMFGSAHAATVLMDFNNGQNLNSTGGYFKLAINDRTHGPDYQIMSISSEETALSSAFALEDQVVQCNPENSQECHVGNMYLFYISNPNQKALVPQAYGHNRLSFYVKIPDNYPLRNGNYDMHVGTYTRHPTLGDQYSAGLHYYHWFNIPGSSYWTKVVCNEHPQHRTGHQMEDPGVNPTTSETDPGPWNYYDGLTRFYIDMVPESPIPLPWKGYIDEFVFYSTQEPEDDVNISSLTCTYMGAGQFYLGWQGNTSYLDTTHQYEVRWSLSPITNANYDSATIVPGAPFGGSGNQTGWVGANFTVPSGGTTYYFAIKDLDGGSSFVSKIDYNVESPIPLSPINLKVRP